MKQFLTACMVKNFHKRQTYTSLQKTWCRATQALASTSLNTLLGSRLCAQSFRKNSCVAASFCKVKKPTFQASKINFKNGHKPTAQKKHPSSAVKNSIPKMHAFILKAFFTSCQVDVQPFPPSSCRVD